MSLALNNWALVCDCYEQIASFFLSVRDMIMARYCRFTFAFNFIFFFSYICTPPHANFVCEGILFSRCSSVRYVLASAFYLAKYLSESSHYLACTIK